MKRVFILFVILIGMVTGVFALDYSSLVPDNDSINNIKLKYKHLGDRKAVTNKDNSGYITNVDMQKVTEVIKGFLPINMLGYIDLQKFYNLLNQKKVDKYVFYLFSRSIGKEGVVSVLRDLAKANDILAGRNIHFVGVIRGLDEDKKTFRFLQSIGKENSMNVKVKINPLIFRAVNANMVPAFLYAECPSPENYRTKKCNFKYIIYGEMSLHRALELLSDKTKDRDIDEIYMSLRGEV